MVEYVCKECGKIFTHKANYTRHISRKFACRCINKCSMCNKQFRYRSNLHRHEKKCRTDIINNTINSVTHNNNTIHNNNSLVSVNKVKVIKFGDENLSYISDDIYKQILSRGIRAIEEFIGHSHFDEQHPENHNLYIANLRDDYLMLYDGDKWTINRRDDSLEDIIYAKSDFLCRKFMELVDTMDPKDAYKFKKYMEVMDDEKTISRIKEDLSINLYNNRKLPMNARQQMELEEQMMLEQYAKLNIDGSIKGINGITDLLKEFPQCKINAMLKIANSLKNM